MFLHSFIYTGHSCIELSRDGKRETKKKEGKESKEEKFRGLEAPDEPDDNEEMVVKLMLAAHR